MKYLTAFILGLSAVLCACGGGSSATGSASSAADGNPAATDIAAAFNADSAYSYVSRQVEFGPRVPNTAAHEAAGHWLASELRRHGAQVLEMPVDLKAFDGTVLKAKNILGSFNPDAKDRVLLVAHWDCRPWADEDPDESRRHEPVPGANDGASGVGILLEIARQLGMEAPTNGVDILFVDAEDWGDTGRDDSWALGAKHFAANMPQDYVKPRCGVLLDMVGGKNAVFRWEQHSQYYAPQLVTDLWATASAIGYGDRFSNEPGGYITDDHLEFIRYGIPVIDIIEYDPEYVFNSRWHTTADDMEGIDAATLNAVGTTVMTWLRKQ